MEKHFKGRSRECKGWSSTPGGTRHKILAANRKQAECITHGRAGTASRFLLRQLQPLADPSIQLLSPKKHVLGKGYAAGPRGAAHAQL